jgi:hypothetical protein
LKKLTLVAATAVAALAPASTLAAPAASGPGKPTVVLQFLDVTTRFQASFPENREPVFGERFAFTDDVYRWSGRKRGALVGHANITAVVIGPNLSSLSAVAHLPGGTLIIYGDNANDARAQTFAVIGGTGRYATARGELHVRNLGGENSNTSAITVKLWM